MRSETVHCWTGLDTGCQRTNCPRCRYTSGYPETQWDQRLYIAEQAWTQVVREPIVQDADTQVGGSLIWECVVFWQPSSRGTVWHRGYWYRCPPSYTRFCSWSSKTKRMYKQAIEDHRGAFTPFVTSVNGLLHCEAKHFLTRMATSIASKWQKPHAQALWLHQSKALICHSRSSHLCLRGSRVKWRSGLGFDDGAPLYWTIHWNCLNHLFIHVVK